MMMMMMMVLDIASLNDAQ